MSRLWRAASLLVLAQLLAACGGKSTGLEGAQNDGGSTGNGGTSTGGSSSAAGSGGSAACTRFDDESPSTVQVLLVNKTSKPIYLGQQEMDCNIVPLFTVANDSGMPLSALGSCRIPCSALHTQGGAGCATICAIQQSIKLEPGEAHETVWDALYRVDGALPASCIPGNDSDMKCDQAKRITAGTYHFSAVAGLEGSCASGADDCGACVGDADGGCSIRGGLIGGQLLKAEASYTLDSAYGFYDSAPAPQNEGAGAGPSGSGSLAIAIVELIFTD